MTNEAGLQYAGADGANFVYADSSHAVLRTSSTPVADQSLKKDAGKLPWHLLPYDALEEVVKVLQFGANKYAERGWEVGIPYSRVFGAIMRHAASWWRGENKDPETGLNPLAHLACEVLFILAFELRRMPDELDDRPVAPRASYHTVSGASPQPVVDAPATTGGRISGIQLGKYGSDYINGQLSLGV